MTSSAASVYYSKHSEKNMHTTHSIAIKQGTYVQLLALSYNIQDSFDKVIRRLIEEHNGHKNKENTVAHSETGLVPTQSVATTTLRIGDNLER